MKRSITLLTALLLCLPSTIPPLAAQEPGAPALISYQGKLVQPNGAAYADGNHAVTFRLYDAPTGGTLIWGATYTVPVAGGVFSVALGAPGGQPLNPLPPVTDLRFAFGGSNRYLELTVAGNPLLPRQQMTSVPYAMNGVPPGTVVPFAGAAIPEGWVRCDGAAYAATDARYAALAATLLTTYGTGGAGTFRVPDLRGRTAIGTGQGDTWAGAGGATNWALAAKFGAEKHQLTEGQMPSHKHDVRDKGHTHSLRSPVGNIASRGGQIGLEFVMSWEEGGGSTHRRTSPSQADIEEAPKGSDQPHNNMQPSLALNYIIKL